MMKIYKLVETKSSNQGGWKDIEKALKSIQNNSCSNMEHNND